MIMGRVLSIVIGYICGLFLAGFLYGKYKKVDVRKSGSGNVGTTNTLRTLGWKAGAITLAGDIGKVFVAMLVVWLIFREGGLIAGYEDCTGLLRLYAGFGAILGHDFPIYMKFKGGKGIASTGGLVLAFCPKAAIVSLSLFIIIVLLTRYVSLGSVLALISLLIQIFVMGKMDWLPVSKEYRVEVYVIFTIITIVGIVKHRSNIVRLWNGTENKFGSGKKEGAK